jgi:hypothetical protein
MMFVCQKLYGAAIFCPSLMQEDAIAQGKFNLIRSLSL